VRFQRHRREQKVACVMRAGALDPGLTLSPCPICVIFAIKCEQSLHHITESIAHVLLDDSLLLLSSGKPREAAIQYDPSKEIK
jgi:hypothetical protein